MAKLSDRLLLMEHGLSHMLQELTAGYDVAAVVLFGSMRQGGAVTPSSDIDCLVITDGQDY